MDGLFLAFMGLVHTNEGCLLVCAILGFSSLLVVTYLMLCIVGWYQDNLRRPRGAQVVLLNKIIRGQLSIASVIALLVLGGDMTEYGARSFESAIIVAGSLTVLGICLPGPLMSAVRTLMEFADKRSAEPEEQNATVLEFPQGKQVLRRAA